MSKLDKVKQLARASVNYWYGKWLLEWESEHAGCSYHAAEIAEMAQERDRQLATIDAV